MWQQFKTSDSNPSVISVARLIPQSLLNCLSAAKMELGMKMEFRYHTQSHTQTQHVVSGWCEVVGNSVFETKFNWLMW